MSDDTSRRNKKEIEEDLGGVRTAYVLNHASGLYEPKSQAGNYLSEHQTDCAKLPSPLTVDVIRDWIPIVISGFTLVLLAVTVYYAHKQWIEANRSADAATIAANAATASSASASQQLDLTKRQWEYSQSAKIGIHSIIQFSPDKDAYARFYVDLLNDGQEVATRVRAVMHLKRVTLNNKIIGILGNDPIIIAPPFGITPATENVGRQAWLDTHRYSLNGENGIKIILKPEAIKAIKDAREIISLTGSVAYNDGFDDKTVPICLKFITYAPEDNISFHDNDFVSCSGFSWLREYILNAKQNYTTNHPGNK